MPTSITVAPGLIQSPRTISGAADRGDDDVGAAHDARAGRGSCEWATVTVALSPISSCAIGLPTMFERPITTASSPARSPSSCLEQVQAAERRARHERRQPGREPAGIHRMEAVDVLAGLDRLDHPRRVDLRWERQLDEDSVDALVGVEVGRPAAAARPRRSCRGKVVREARHAGFGRRPVLRADINGAGRVLADQHGGEARAAGRAVARTRRHRAATASRIAAAAAFPSISLAVMRSPG